MFLRDAAKANLQGCARKRPGTASLFVLQDGHKRRKISKPAMIFGFAETLGEC
jgi:hypothetical protein